MKNFCILPFNSISIAANGDLRACCNAENGGFGVNANTLSIEKILNNQPIRKLRKTFLQDERSEYCNRCWRQEDEGSESFRIMTTKNDYGNPDVVKPGEIISFDNIQYLDITVGNKCNLACRMCEPSSSSLVAKQHRELGIESLPGGDIIEFSRETKNKIIEIIDRSPNLSTIFMLGGEPLVADFAKEIVEYLIDTGKSKNITLEYNTNLQIDIEKNLEQWSKFKQINLQASIDGCFETYEYIRWPGSWSKISKNLKYVTEYITEYKNVYPSIATTVQNLNVDNISNLISESNLITNNVFNFYFIPVSGRNFIEMIPIDVLYKSYFDIKQFEHKNVYRIPDLLSMIEHAIYRNKDLNKRTVEDFFRRQKMYDEYRKQNLFDLKPHFAVLAKQFNINIW